MSGNTGGPPAAERPRPGKTRRLPVSPVPYGSGHASTRLLVVALTAGVIATALTAVFGDWRYALAVGWDTAALVFCTWIWTVVWPMPASETAARATAEDPNRPVSDVLVLSASVASLAAVALVLVQGHSVRPPAQVLLAALGLVSVAVSWLTVHTVYMLRYAVLYYSPPRGGIQFNQEEPPAYRDFAYVALTLGMTYQVADTSLESSVMRSTVIRHALMSYLFGSIILATVVNLIAGLGTSLSRGG
jgi:uncharacterized membrane protein